MKIKSVFTVLLTLLVVSLGGCAEQKDDGVRNVPILMYHDFIFGGGGSLNPSK